MLLEVAARAADPVAKKAANRAFKAAAAKLDACALWAP